MSVLYLLIPLALVFSALAVLAFAWASRRGQFDDLVTPAVRVLHDEDPSPRTRALRRSGDVSSTSREKP